MRPSVIGGLAVCLLSACPLEPLTITGFGVSSSVIRPGSTGRSPTVTLSVPGLRAQDATGLTALLNGVPVPIAATRDGELSISIPSGLKGDAAKFELWRSGELLTSRDIAALLAQGISGQSPTDGVTVRTNGETTSTTPVGSGGVTINITVPAGSTSGGGGTTTVVTTDGTGSTNAGSNSGTNTGTGASPTPSPTATPVPTPTPTATPTPAPTLVPVADQTPVPGGTGEVQGNVQF
jgi:hypothetical protein